MLLKPLQPIDRKNTVNAVIIFLECWVCANKSERKGWQDWGLVPKTIMSKIWPPTHMLSLPMLASRRARCPYLAGGALLSISGYIVT